MAYELDLLKEFSLVHEVFHISMVYKYDSNLPKLLKALDNELSDYLSYKE